MINGRIVSTVVACLLCGAAGIAQAEEAPTLEQELGHGYAMLHDAFHGLQHVDNALILKREAKPVRDVIVGLAEMSDRLDETLERLAATEPTIDLEDQGLTRFELAKRRSVTIDRGLGLGTPILGRVGADLERTALLTLAAAINQQRHLVKVMTPHESNAARLRWLAQARTELDSIYDEIVALLERDYFCAAAA